MIRRLALAALLPLTLAACAAPRLPALGEAFSRDKPLEVVERRRSPDCGTEGREPRVRAFDSVAQFESWANARGLQLFGDAQLPEARYALVEMGQRATGGFGLAVSRQALRRGSTLVLSATFVSPAPGEPVTQALTAPCVLVQLPEAPYTRLELRDQSGERKATWTGERA
jgi:hypothetical protein